MSRRATLSGSPPSRALKGPALQERDMRHLALVVVVTAVAATPAVAAGAPTFSKDVAPILFKSCVECHRPSAMAPMSLMTYEDARPWARAIRQKVATRQMPPWGADPTVGKYSNDVS